MEVSTLSRLQHPSIVSLVGICVEGDQRIAVFELLQRGSLSSALHPEESSHGSKQLPGLGQVAPRHRREPLLWRERVQVALDIAQGLAYLHKVRHPGLVGACKLGSGRKSLRLAACQTVLAD